MNDRQLVLDTVEEICADTNNIDEVCMALEHSTIFATEMIQNLVEVIDKYKNVIDKIKEYCIKEQARIVINNTEEDEFVYTELLQLIDKLLEEVE